MDTATPLTDEQLEAVEQTLHDHLGPNWTQDYIEGDGNEPDYYRVATAQGLVLATVPDWAGSIALFLVEAHDYVPRLLAEIRRLRAQVAERDARIRTALDHVAAIDGTRASEDAVALGYTIVTALDGPSV